MKKATVIFHVVLDTEEMDLKYILQFHSVEQLQLAVKENLSRCGREGITYVPDGGKEMRFWPSHRVKYIQAVISES